MIRLQTRLLLLCLAISACDTYRDPPPVTDPAQTREASNYLPYGGDGGRQFSDSGLINRDNVHRLKPLWSFHTGEMSSGSAEVWSPTSFQLTPILAEGLLYICTPFNRVIALDPLTGAQAWAFDPKLELKAHYSNMLTCRGVSYWKDAGKQDGEMCASRIFTNTNDTRLIALDAQTGTPCSEFGEAGFVNTAKGIGEASYPGEHHHTSPPTIIGDRVIVGGTISDGAGVSAPSGVVRAYNARTGALEWAQDLAPPNYPQSSENRSTAGYLLATPNVWAPMSADEEIGLIYAPTGNPLPDYFRNEDISRAHYGSSLVAIDASSGDIRWHYQFVHRDFWDFDTPAQPTLFELERNGERIPAVAQGTKMGFIFILDRRTGQPLFPVEERPVPQNPDFPNLELSATQPFPLLPQPVAAQTLDPEEAFGFTFYDRQACREELTSLRYQGMYTPVSPEWTLMYAGNAGGINWGGLAIDERTQTLVVNSSNLAFKVKLIPRQDFEAVREANPGQEMLRQPGTPWGLWRVMIQSPFGTPCNPPPWGLLTGIDLRTGEHIWQSTLGTTRDLAPLPIALNTGTPSLGGPLMTAGGLTFIGGALEHYLRAFDSDTGEELWKGRLPAAGIATPMSYTVVDTNGEPRQLVLIAAGGYGRMPFALSDTLLAFGLPDSH